MAMSIEELEMESAELVPAREVMCGCTHHSSGSYWYSQTNNGSGNGVTQVGLLGGINDSLNNNNVILF